MANMQQHYQTCKNLKCPLFDANELNCSILKIGNCKYQTIHVIQDASVDQYLDGKKHGVYRQWDRKGQLRLESSWVNGKLNGVSRQWQDGRLVHKCNYIDSVKHGIYKRWNSHGKLIVDWNLKK